MSSADRSRSSARSRSRGCEEIERIERVTVTAPSRSHSRVSFREEDEQYKLTTVKSAPAAVSLEGRSRDVSRSRSYHYEDSKSCVPCDVVRPSSTLRKRLIVCCDGTFCASDKGKDNNPTNIARLSRVIANTGLDGQCNPIPQIVSYQSGVGTGKLTKVGKATQGMFGEGLTEKVCEAYTFLANNYGPGDEIFIFGFSRGAYTARSLASFICQVGLLSPGMMDYFSDIFNAYKNRDRRTEKTFRDMEWAQRHVRPGELGFETGRTDRVTRYEWVRQWAHLHARIKVVGVYDTVGSVGMSGWVHQPGQDVGWQTSKLHPKIEYAFQALALDESRGNFPPTLFYLDQACRKAGTVLHQCWFPGYHSCIGGESSAQHDINSMDEITFAWMIDQLTRYNLLQVNKRALNYPILDRLSVNMTPNGNHPIPPRNAQEVHERRIDWSDGRLQETNTLLWHVASEVATERWDYVRKPGEYHAYDDKTAHRLEYDAFQETIHPTVWHRIQHRNYEPRCMPLDRWSRRKRSDGRGYEWIKASKSGLIQVCIPEYVIPDIHRKETGMDHWTGCLEHRIAPGDYLRKLDQGNGIVRGGKRPALATRVDSGYHSSGYDEGFLSPTSATRMSSSSGYDGYFRETVTIRESSPRPGPKGAAAEYYDVTTVGL